MKIFLAALFALSLTACGSFHARPDLAQSTLTQPGSCVKGYKAEKTAGVESLGYSNAVVVTNERCMVSK